MRADDGYGRPKWQRRRDAGTGARGSAQWGTDGAQWAAADGRGSPESDSSGSPASGDGPGSSSASAGSPAVAGRGLPTAGGRGPAAAAAVRRPAPGRPFTSQPPLAISTDTVPSAMCSASTSSGSSRSGISGAHQTLPDGTAGSNRSSVRSSRNGAAAAHACGEHEVGYATGAAKSERSNPQNSSGSLPPNLSAASRIPPAICCACGTNPYRISPAAQIALSCGHTDPLW